MSKAPTDPNEHIKQPDGPSRFEIVVNAIRDRLFTLLAFGLIVSGLLLYVGFDPEIPRTVKVFFLALALLSPAGYILGNYIVSLLWTTTYIYLVDLDAAETDGAIYRFPFDTFREIETTDGQLDRVSPHFYIGKNVDLENLTVDGTWRGTLSDRELLRQLQKVEECRGILEDDAKRGFVIESQAWTIIRGATRKAVLSVVSTFERGSLPDDGNGINQEIDAALDQFDLDRHIRDETDTPEPSEVSESPEDLEPEADVSSPGQTETAAATDGGKQE